MSLSYHFVYAPSVLCSSRDFGAPTLGTQQRSPESTCDYRVRGKADRSSSGFAMVNDTHPAYMQYETCAKRSGNTGQLDCDTKGLILYARFGTPPDASLQANYSTGYIYRLVKGQFACNEAFFGNWHVDLKNADCALSTMSPVPSGKSSEMSSRYCANEGFHCMPPHSQGVTYTSMELKNWKSSFFLASEGPRVSCHPNAYVVDPKSSSKTGYCNVWEAPQFAPQPVARWVNVASCQNCKLSMAFKWGVTTQATRALTKKWRSSLTNTIRGGFSFLQEEGDARLVNDRSAHAVSQMMQEAMSKRVTSTCLADCGSSESETNVWQWQMDFGEPCQFGDVCPFSLYSCNLVCRSGPNGTRAPSCPLGQCADAHCNTCKKRDIAFDPKSTGVRMLV